MMRLKVIGAAVLLGFAAVSSGCSPEVSRVDPEDVADRALVGAVAGAALGTGIGATLAINPAVGAVIGVESGAVIGAAIGAMTAQPLPAYSAVAPLEGSPEYYETWPPGFLGGHAPPASAGAPPPPP